MHAPSPPAVADQGPCVSSVRPSRGDGGAFLLGVAVVSLAALLCPAFFAGPLALDEHVSYWMLDSEHSSTLWERSLNIGAVPPLSFIPQRWLLALTGQSEWAMRLPSLLFAWATLPIVYSLGRKLGGGTCGGVAALLLAWHPDLLDEVRIGRCYGQVEFLSALLLFATVWWKERFHSWFRLSLWGGSASALIWTHYTAAPLVVIAGLWLVFEGYRSPSRGRVIAMLGLVASAVTVTTVPLWSAAERLSEWSPYLNMLAAEAPLWRTVTPFWWLGIPTGAVLAWLLSRRSSLPITPSVLNAGRAPQQCSEGWLLLLASLGPLLLIAWVAVGDHSSLANPRYRVAYVPAGAIWAAWLLTRSGAWRIAIPATLVTLIAAWSMEPLRPWQLGRLGAQADRDWQAVSQSIRERSKEGEPLLVQGGLVESSLVPAYCDNPLFLEYVGSRISRYSVPESHPRWGLPYFWDAGTQSAFASLIRSNAAGRLWIAGATDTDLARASIEGARQVALDAGFQVQSEQALPNAVLIEMTKSPGLAQ